MSLVGFSARNHPQQRARPEVDERQTPPELFDPLNERFRFTVDASIKPNERPPFGVCLLIWEPAHVQPEGARP